MIRFAIALLAASAMTAAAQTKVLTVAPGPDAQERIQTALLDAKPGDTVQLAAGRLRDAWVLDLPRSAEPPAAGAADAESDAAVDALIDAAVGAAANEVVFCGRLCDAPRPVHEEGPRRHGEGR